SRSASRRLSAAGLRRPPTSALFPYTTLFRSKAHGIWTDVDAEATLYLDRTTDLPLRRLRLVGAPDEERSGGASLRFVDEYMAGDVIPLYLQGLVLCQQEDPGVCVAECPLASRCPFPRKANDVVRNVDSVRF